MYIYLTFVMIAIFFPPRFETLECKSPKSQEGGGQPGFQEQQLWRSLPAVHRGTDDWSEQYQDQRKTVLQ